MWQKVEKRLAELGMKRADLARALGVDNQHVYNWSRRGLPSDRYRDVAEALDMPTSWLFDDDQPAANEVRDGSAEYRVLLNDLDSLAAIARGLSGTDRHKLIRIAEVFATSPTRQIESTRTRDRINEKKPHSPAAARKARSE